MNTFIIDGILLTKGTTYIDSHYNADKLINFVEIENRIDIMQTKKIFLQVRNEIDLRKIKLGKKYLFKGSLNYEYGELNAIVKEIEENVNVEFYNQ